MAISTLIIGESGSGKTTSLRNLNSAETFIIQVVKKPLPFKNTYKPFDKNTLEGRKGNLYVTRDYSDMVFTLSLINKKLPHITNVIIDDFQYIMAMEYVRMARDKGYDRFNEIVQQACAITDKIEGLRDNLFCFVFTHSTTDEDDVIRPKTIGKMFDKLITLEGLFTVVLQTKIIDHNYYFATQSDGLSVAKSPMGMFDKLLIDNDLASVRRVIAGYYNIDIPM